MQATLLARNPYHAAVAFRDVFPRRRTVVFTAAVLAVAALLFLAFFYAFGGWSLSVPADLTIANGDEPQTLDPAIVTAQLDQRICLAIYEGLTSCDPAGNIGPGVAEKWEMSPDGRTYTFHLRANAQWSNGEPLTARDFVESWKRVLDPATASDYAYQLFYLVNGEAYYNRTVTDFAQVGVKAPDDRTLVVTLNHPTAYFLQLTAAMQTLFPVPLATVRRYGDDWTKPGKIVGNGPYVLKAWRLNDYILLEANPHYWRPVAIKRIRVLPTRDANTCFNLFYSGKVDLILDQSSIPPVLLPDIRKQPYYHRNPIGSTTFVRFNVKRHPFDDVRVRKALALALDRQDIVDKIIRTGEPVADTLVPPGDAGYTPPPGLKRDLVEAKRLLAEAGYPEGRGFPDVSLLYSTKGSSAEIATEMQALWARDLGITSIHLRGQEFKVYLNSQSSTDFDLCISRWIGDYADPQTFLDMFVTGGGNNDTNWSDPAYDQLLADSEMTPDPARRMQILQNMERILVDEQLPIFPISFTVGAVLYHPGKLGGFAPNILDDHPWGDLYLPKK
jgi:oligopeptide transport system substrate-binding protein